MGKKRFAYYFLKWFSFILAVNCMLAAILMDNNGLGWAGGAFLILAILFSIFEPDDTRAR